MISFTRITSADTLTKSYSVAKGGALLKRASPPLSSGIAERVQVATLADFAALLATLSNRQALTYGVTEAERATITTKAALHTVEGAIARTREYFMWPNGAAVWFLDYDPEPGTSPLSPETLRAALLDACPALADAPMLIAASASSYIVNAKTGDTLTGPGGLHIYVAVECGTDIARAGAALYARTWLKGRARFDVGNAGQWLDRSIIDASVWQPERLDFAAGAECAKPLEQRRPAPQSWNADAEPFDTTRVEEPTTEEREIIVQNQRASKVAKFTEQRGTRAKYEEATTAALVANGADSDDAARTVGAALDDARLYADFVLYPERGEPVTVAQVLDDPARWHGARFGDPIEPDYRDDRRIAVANLRSGGRAYIYSHAHGGRRFDLLRQPKVLIVQAGEEDRLARQSLAVLATTGDVYAFGDGAATIINGRLAVMSEIRFAAMLSEHVAYSKISPTDDNPNRKVRVSVPLKVMQYARERACDADSPLPRADALVTAPALRLDGTVLDRAGYSAADRLIYLCPEGQERPVLPAPSIEQVRGALAALWAPFTEYRFADDTSRGVMLAALLTAVSRASLPLAPGFGFDAAMAGSGKTILAECCAILTGHDQPPIASEITDNAELEKRLFSMLTEGQRCYISDNHMQAIGGGVWAKCLTSEVYGGRYLSLSQSGAPPNRCLITFTGNNLRTTDDNDRRILIARVEPDDDNPQFKRYPFNPKTICRAKRLEIVRAALTVIRGYFTHGAPDDAETLGSFDDWERLVLQPVLWAARTFPEFRFGNPIASARNNSLENDDKASLCDLLIAIKRCYGKVWAATADVWNLAHSGEERAAPLRTAIASVTGGDTRWSVKKFGLFLRSVKGSRMQGMQLANRCDAHRKVNEWRVIGGDDVPNIEETVAPLVAEQEARLAAFDVAADVPADTPKSPAAGWLDVDEEPAQPPTTAKSRRFVVTAYQRKRAPLIEAARKAGDLIDDNGSGLVIETDNPERLARIAAKHQATLTPYTIQ